MHKMGKSVAEISKITEIKIRTVYNYLKNQKNDENILFDPPKNTRKPSLELDKLQKYIEENPFAFNKEVAKIFEKSAKTIQKWRKKLGFKRKKARKTYKEADPELKKNSKPNLKN